MEKLFLGDVADYSVEQLIDWVAENFCQDKASLSKYEFLVASVNENSYDGNAYFLVKNRETGEYLEVDAAHCSCFGYEDQWEPKSAPKVYLVSDKYQPYWTEVQRFVRNLFN